MGKLVNDFKEQRDLYLLSTLSVLPEKYVQIINMSKRKKSNTTLRMLPVYLVHRVKSIRSPSSVGAHTVSHMLLLFPYKILRED